jgi:hypothetical protein
MLNHFNNWNFLAWNRNLIVCRNLITKSTGAREIPRYQSEQKCGLQTPKCTGEIPYQDRIKCVPTVYKATISQDFANPQTFFWSTCNVNHSGYESRVVESIWKNKSSRKLRMPAILEKVRRFVRSAAEEDCSSPCHVTEVSKQPNHRTWFLFLRSTKENSIY